jgi:hypothetical protein
MQSFIVITGNKKPKGPRSQSIFKFTLFLPKLMQNYWIINLYFYQLNYQYGCLS